MHLRAGLIEFGSWTFAETPFSAISRFNWSPESAEMRPLFRYQKYRGVNP